MASTCEADPDLVAAMKIPAFVRVKKGQSKPKYIAPPDVELEGELADKFIKQIAARTGHYSDDKIAQLGAVSRIYGTARANPELGNLLGAAFGRWWYVVG